MRIALLALVIITSAGCQLLSPPPPAPTDQQILDADVGPCPKQADAESAAKMFFDRMLKDPMSAVVHYQPMAKAAYIKNYGKEWHFGWKLSAIVNAKNSYGGYTGEREWIFYFRKGNAPIAVSIPETDSHGYHWDRVVEVDDSAATHATPTTEAN